MQALPLSVTPAGPPSNKADAARRSVSVFVLQRQMHGVFASASAFGFVSVNVFAIVFGMRLDAFGSICIRLHCLHVCSMLKQRSENRE